MLFQTLVQRKLDDGYDRTLVDRRAPQPPYFLQAEDQFPTDGEREIFIKKIYSASASLPRRGAVVMAPGLAANANLFRTDDRGEILHLNHNRSFANLLASEGFTVYLYHPGYTERVHNRFVATHCPQSIHFRKRYQTPPNLDFSYLADKEIPLVLKHACEDFGNPWVSWVGFSMGGMLMYAYLSKNEDLRVRNVVTIGSPVSLNELFLRIAPYTNMVSQALEMEERTFLGTAAGGLVPVTRLIRKFPASVVRYNPFFMFLWNPFNIRAKTVKTILGNIMEPIPAALHASLRTMVGEGVNSRMYSPEMIRKMRKANREHTNFLFFFGQYDLMARPDSVLLAHEIITPKVPENLKGVPATGHLDLVVGENAMQKVWRPTCRWLRDHLE
ncbi:MAG: alpha/beta fold hydrolase [Deltaproteobacteria bacterium]|nr:alpha/beta fold hydrolase [Deltaproteobacteria bacterium]